MNQLSLFSVNESVEEIPTPVLKFLLLPAFLSSMVSRKRDCRLLLLEQSEIYLEDFLKLVFFEKFIISRAFCDLRTIDATPRPMVSTF